jgi:hypothetical protein
MQTLMGVRLIVFAYLLAASVHLASCSSASFSDGDPQQLECGPELSHAEILRIAEHAISAIGGDPMELAERHEVKIMTAGCDYVFSAVPKGAEAVEGISMRISREGEVKSYPWCCPLGSCPDLCDVSSDEPVSLVRHVTGQEALLAAAAGVRSRLNINSPFSFLLTIGPDGTVKECRFVKAPGPPDATSLITIDDRRELCRAAKELAFPPKGEEYEYGLTLGPSHLQ